ncbi:hypothetical protein GCM10017562_74420 [Streptomyces roseofulvus]
MRSVRSADGEWPNACGPRHLTGAVTVRRGSVRAGSPGRAARGAAPSATSSRVPAHRSATPRAAGAAAVSRPDGARANARLTIGRFWEIRTDIIRWIL